VLDRRVKGDLKRFKGFIEERGTESGGWRGRITPGDATQGMSGSEGSAPGRPVPGPGPLPADPDDMRHG
ncbi:cyclase, partial [Streptomyces sp. NPDC093600]